MSVELRVVIRLLRRPEGVTCTEEYEVEQYRVCIAPGQYIVYDKVAEDPNVDEELREVENLIKRLLLTEDKTPEEILGEVPDKYKGLVRRQFYSYGLLDPFFLDDNIVDVHIVYRYDTGTRIQVVHRRHGRLNVPNIELSLDELREIVLRMATSSGRVVSEAKPLHSFIEPVHDARVTVIYYSDITLRRMLSIDIRKQPKKPWTILKLIDLGTLTPEEAAFLWLVMKYRIPILVIGELMSGKTTLINALINLVPPGSRVLTVEDTPELKVYVDAWHRVTTRESDILPITIFDILKTAMRISADYIVVGEIRGEEARQWAQAILLGHGGITSFHAQSPEAAIVRLRSPPIEVNPQALDQINVVVKMIPLRTRGAELVRRSEVYIYEDGRFTRLFGYDADRDTIEPTPGLSPLSFKFFDRAILAHGVTREQLEEEYRYMVEAVRNVYERAKHTSPSLEDPDYAKLPIMLYRRLELYRLGVSEQDFDEIKESVKKAALLGHIVSKTLEPVIEKYLAGGPQKTAEGRLDEIL